MFAKKILFPTDFSEASTPAFDYAESLARDTGAELLIAHVIEPSTAYGGGESYYGLAKTYYGLAEDEEAESRRRLARVLPLGPDIRYQHRLLSGNAAKAIVKLADAEHVDFIVMGTHGRTGWTRLLMGSVAEAVVRRAACPVLTIKLPHEMAALAD